MSKHLYRCPNCHRTCISPRFVEFQKDVVEFEDKGELRTVLEFLEDARDGCVDLSPPYNRVFRQPMRIYLNEAQDWIACEQEKLYILKHLALYQPQQLFYVEVIDSNAMD